MDIGEVKDMEGYLYILQSQKNHSYYLGSTINLQQRLLEHDSGKNKSTTNLRPITLVFSKKYSAIKEARQMEYRLKKFKSRTIIERIIRDQDIKMGC